MIGTAKKGAALSQYRNQSRAAALSWCGARVADSRAGRAANAANTCVRTFPNLQR